MPKGLDSLVPLFDLVWLGFGPVMVPLLRFSYHWPVFSCILVVVVRFACCVATGACGMDFP